MARDWHELFRTWAKPPSETEEEKASRAAQMVREAVRGTGRLADHAFDVYPTGSYRNNTNIRLGSDVDIAIVLKGAFFYQLPSGRRPEEFGFGQGAAYGLAEFKRDLGLALRDAFGADLSEGNKTFDIAGNSYRLPADATPFLVHRAYSGNRLPDGQWQFVEGVETRPKNQPERRLINWHQQHYEWGVAKNTATNRRFKRVTRILKRLRDDMTAQGSPEAQRAAQSAASFLLECVAFNAADSCFNQSEGTYYQDVRSVIAAGWSATKGDDTAASLVEVSRRKTLFGGEQAWSRAQAHEFLLRAWRHVGFE